MVNVLTRRFISDLGDLNSAAQPCSWKRIVLDHKIGRRIRGEWRGILLSFPVYAKFGHPNGDVTAWGLVIVCHVSEVHSSSVTRLGHMGYENHGLFKI